MKGTTNITKDICKSHREMFLNCIQNAHTHMYAHVHAQITISQCHAQENSFWAFELFVMRIKETLHTIQAILSLSQRNTTPLLISPLLIIKSESLNQGFYATVSGKENN